MRFILQYTLSEEYEYSYTEIVPIIAESKQAILDELQIATEKFIHEQHKSRAAWENFNKKYPVSQRYKFSKKKREEFDADRLDLIERAKPPSDKYELSGQPIFISHLAYDGKFIPPDIFTVDEWFNYRE